MITQIAHHERMHLSHVLPYWYSCTRSSASTDSAGVRKLAPEMTDEMTEQTGSVSFLTNSTAVEIPRWNSAVSTMEMVHPVRYIWC